MKVLTSAEEYELLEEYKEALAQRDRGAGHDRREPPPADFTREDVFHILVGAACIPLGLVILLRTMPVMVAPPAVVAGLGIHRVRTLPVSDCLAAVQVVPRKQGSTQAMSVTLNPLGIVLATIFLVSMSLLFYWMFRVPPATPLPVAVARRSVTRIHRILVPVVETVASERAVELACRLGEDQKAEIVLAFIMVVPMSVPLEAPIPSLEATGRQALDTASFIVHQHNLLAKPTDTAAAHGLRRHPAHRPGGAGGRHHHGRGRAPAFAARSPGPDGAGRDAQGRVRSDPGQGAKG